MKRLDSKVAKALKKARVTDARRHLFLCLGPDCCAPETGQATWDYIKSRTKELDLPIMRTKALCFRICSSGPWLVVYPEGVWYTKVTPKRFERILQEHLLGGKPVTKWIAARNPLRSSELAAFTQGCGEPGKLEVREDGRQKLKLSDAEN